jgi:ABC-type nickel/cobalt efflux system permease component RcnA
MRVLKNRPVLHHRLLLAAAFLALAVAVHANPFYGSADDDIVVPVAPSIGRPGMFVGLQLEMRERMALAFNRTNEGPGALLALLGLTFAYGILHAAGPGHRKTVVFSMFLGSKARFWEPMAVGFLSAAVHAGSGAILILILSLVRGAAASFGAADSILVWMDGGSLLVLALLALVLIVLKLRELLSGKHHHHGAAGKGRYGMIIVASLVPCPGTIMVLLFALYLDALLLGVAAIAAIALGMGLVVSAAAYLAWFGRQGLFNRLKASEHSMAKFSGFLELGSYTLILVFSLSTVRPFVMSLIQGL